jgi:hypothetical protein
MFNFLEGLKGIELQANPTKEVKTKEVSTPRVEKTPTNGADFRILANGKVYPSQQFVDEFGLEYTNKDSGIISKGLDLFDSAHWGAYPKEGTPRLLLGYTYLQSEPKIELFAGLRYNEDNTPVSSVMEQGTVIKEDTRNMMAQALGYDSWESMIGEAQYVDFYMVRNVGTSLTMPDGIYNIPKMVERGEKKGEWSYIRREKLNVLPIVLVTDEVLKEIQATKTKQEGNASDAVWINRNEIASQVDDSSEDASEVVSEVKEEVAA